MDFLMNSSPLCYDLLGSLINELENGSPSFNTNLKNTNFLSNHVKFNQVNAVCYI